MKIFIMLLLLASNLVWADSVAKRPIEQANKPSLPDSQVISRYLAALDKTSDHAKLVQLGRSAGGRPIEALLFSGSAAFLQNPASETDKATVMLLGSQHGNEPAGAEAMLQLARELGAGQHSALLQQLNLVLVVMANPDGRDLATRHNANNDNTNIDFVALQASETRLLVDALHRFNPDVVYDAHESGIWKRVLTKEQGWMTDVEAQFDMGNNPNIDKALHDYTEHTLLPALIERVSAAGLPASRYRGEITRLEQSVARGGLGITNLRNYAALQGRVSILVENRLDNKGGTYATPQNIAERVRKQHLSMLTMLQLIADEADRLLKVSRQARRQWASGAKGEQVLSMDFGFGVNRRQPEVQLPLVRLADGHKAWHRFANHDAVLRRQSVALPVAYAITRERERMAQWLARHHITFTTLAEPRLLMADQLVITGVQTQESVRSGGREKVQAEVEVSRQAVTLQAGDVWVPMDQPLAPLAALMLDPRSANALYQEQPWSWLALGEFPVFPVVEPLTEAP
ncbi:M14 family zinc carboxypeptidase [Oceanisphaera sp.]|uniref:M14 family zinc carboxypeptidase n=1 Tax=Oceanisphaera sp. TaxID=1929979 RepID=UPI003A93D25E